MKHISMRTFVALSVATGGGSLGVIAACSSNSSAPPPDNMDVSGPNSPGSSGSGSTASGSSSTSDTDAGSGSHQDANALVTYDGPPANADAGKLVCATPDGLTIKFNPIYSGFDGTHTYQVPMFVEGIDPAPVHGVPRTRRWSTSTPTFAAS